MQTRVTIDIDGACKGPLWYVASRRNAIVTETTPPSQDANRIARRLAVRGRARRQKLKSYLRNHTWTFLRGVAVAPVSWRREHWILGAGAVLMTIVVGMIMPTFASATRNENGAVALTTLNLELPHRQDWTSQAQRFDLRGRRPATTCPWFRRKVPSHQLADLLLVPLGETRKNPSRCHLLKRVRRSLPARPLGVVVSIHAPLHREERQHQ